MIYLIYGEERYLINEKINDIKKEYKILSKGINYINIDGNDFESQLKVEIEMPAFGFDKKLIILHNTDCFFKSSDNLLEYLENNLKILSSSDIIFLEENVRKNNKLYKFVDKNGLIFEYPKIDKKNINQLITLINKYVSSFNNKYNINLNIANFQIQYLIEYVGFDIYIVLNELNKILMYYLYRKIEEEKVAEKTAEKINEAPVFSHNITKEDIDNLTIASKETIIFEISNNILQNNLKRANDAVDNLIYLGDNVQSIIGYIYGIYRNIYLMSIARNEGYNPSEVLPERQRFLYPKYQSYIITKGQKYIKDQYFKLIKLDEDSKLRCYRSNIRTKKYNK